MKCNACTLLVFSLLALSGCNGGGCSKDTLVDWKDSEGMMTYVLDNGSVLYDSIGLAPANEKLTLVAGDGRVLAVAGACSESSGYCLVKYLYDRKGRVKELRRGFQEFTGELDSESRQRLLGVMLGADSLHERFCLKWGGAVVTEVYDPVHHLSIKAPEGKHVEYAVRESDLFWGSCMRGGCIVVLFYVAPNEWQCVDECVVDVYCGYRLQQRKEYKSGRLWRKTLFCKDGGEVCDVITAPADGSLYQMEKEYFDMSGKLFDEWEEEYAAKGN